MLWNELFGQPSIKQITNTVVRTYCIAQGTTQYSVITYMRKESEKEWIYVYVLLNHFAVYLKITQYCESIILQ